jgi:RluA family pseudouridine synthase
LRTPATLVWFEHFRRDNVPVGFHLPFTVKVTIVVDSIPVLWSSESLLVVNKPAGVSTQAPHVHDSLECRLQEQLAPNVKYLAFPHRLDRPVSGVILVATSKLAAKLLGAQFEARKIEKTYLACVAGNVDLSTDTLWIDWIRKTTDEARVDIVAANSENAKLAETYVQRLGYSPDHGCSIIRLRPNTGRMHQLRVQAAHRGFPILGDNIYGTAETVDRPPFSFHPLEIALHAHTIAFHEPKRGIRTTVTAPPPVPLVQAMKACCVDLT